MADLQLTPVAAAALWSERCHQQTSSVSAGLEPWKQQAASEPSKRSDNHKIHQKKKCEKYQAVPFNL
jgi:hypothetical protein